MSPANERRARELVATWRNIGFAGDSWEGLVGMVEAALDEAEARGAVKWRPASEPPECDNPDGVFVLGWRAGMSEPQKRWWSPRIGFEVEVTHWMPLPEPPTPTTEEG